VDVLKAASGASVIKNHLGGPVNHIEGLTPVTGVMHFMCSVSVIEL
jgi:hypothetical protein